MFIDKQSMLLGVQSAPPQDTGLCSHAFWNISTLAATLLLVMLDVVETVPRMFDAAVILHSRSNKLASVRVFIVAM
jgi:hypothetical protein